MDTHILNMILIFIHRVCYERSPWNPMLMSFLVSAWWHGFYPGYYLCLFSFALSLTAAKKVHLNTVIEFSLLLSICPFTLPPEVYNVCSLYKHLLLLPIPTFHSPCFFIIMCRVLSSLCVPPFHGQCLSVSSPSLFSLFFLPFLSSFPLALPLPHLPLPPAPPPLPLSSIPVSSHIR